MSQGTGKDNYYVEATNWDKNAFDEAIKSSKRSKTAAIVGALIGVLGVVTVYIVLPIKTWVPVVVRVNQTTGEYDVNGQGLHLDIQDKRNEKIMYADLGRYIKAREGFTRGEAQKNYNVAYLMSCGSVRTDVSNYFLPEVNKQSPLVTMQVDDADQVDIKNIVFLPTDADNYKVAQVYFDKTFVRGGVKKSRVRYMSTITYKYDEKNIPTTQDDMTVNAFGFCAQNYRKDQEGEAVNLMATAEVNQVDSGVSQ